jgi:hypothetical protein
MNIIVHIFSTDREMIRATNATDTHAQNFVANDELLLPILKSFAYCTKSLHATQNIRYFQSACSSRTVCCSYQWQFSSTSYNQQCTAPHQTRPYLAEIKSWFLIFIKQSTDTIGPLSVYFIASSHVDSWLQFGVKFF